MDTEKSLSREQERNASYRILSACYYPPDEKLIAMLDEHDTLSGELGCEIAKAFPGEEKLEELKIDYSRLFVGPFKLIAPPYGSIYLENGRQTMGDSTIDAKRRYKEEGLDIFIKEAPDHIAVELEFMYFLIFNASEAIKEQDPETADSYLKKQRSFLKDHLGEWISKFTEDVESNASTDFYRDLARATRLFIEEDLKYIFSL